MSERVQGYCPWCGSSSLFLGSSGYITCSVVDCPNPTGITDLLTRETEHIVKLTEDHFTIQHPMRERAEGELFDCGIHTYLATLSGPPRREGKYRVFWRGDTNAAWEALSK